MGGPGASAATLAIALVPAGLATGASLRRSPAMRIPQSGAKERLIRAGENANARDRLTRLTDAEPERLRTRHHGSLVLVHAARGTFGEFFFAADAAGNLCGIKQMLSFTAHQHSLLREHRKPATVATYLHHARTEVALTKMLAPGLLARELILGTDQSIYLVMRLMDGTARDLLRLAPAHQKQAIGRAVLRGAAARYHIIHTQGFIHGDVKLDNVLWSRDGSLEVSDLGSTTKRERRGPSGTYFAPEMFEKERLWGPKAEVFVLGVSLAASYHVRSPTLFAISGASDETMAGVADDFSMWWEMGPPAPTGQGHTSVFDAFFAPMRDTDPALLASVKSRMLNPNPRWRCDMAEAVAFGRNIAPDSHEVDVAALLGSQNANAQRDALLGCLQELARASGT